MALSTISSGATTAAQNSITPAKKVAFAALQHRHFRYFFVTTMLAMMADNIEHVISYWLLFQKFESPVLAGFADIILNTTSAILGLFWSHCGSLPTAERSFKPRKSCTWA